MQLRPIRYDAINSIIIIIIITIIMIIMISISNTCHYVKYSVLEPEVGKGEGGGIFRKWREMNRNGRYIKIRYMLRDAHMGCSRRPALPTLGL